MQLDIGWAISLSLATIVVTLGVLAIINVRAKSNNNANKKTNGFVN